MSSWERKDEILRLLQHGRRWLIAEFACELNVSIRTVKNDIQELATRYPIITSPGKNGGIWLDKNPNIYRGNFCNREEDVLTHAIMILSEHNYGETSLSLEEILRVHGSRKNVKND
jgi:predicted DNA-binding transcriptional regulator YafY